jgi:hypothetical protein
MVSNVGLAGGLSSMDRSNENEAVLCPIEYSPTTKDCLLCDDLDECIAAGRFPGVS